MSSITNERSFVAPAVVATVIVFSQTALSQVVNPANGHTYYVSDEMMLAWDAETWAQSLGGHLATVNDADENDWLHTTFAGLGYTHFWIGLTDSEAYGGYEGGDDPLSDGWVWMSGEDVDFLNWNSGEPNGATYPGQDFVEMHISGYWNDLEDITYRYGVAEVVPVPGSLTVVAIVVLARLRDRRRFTQSQAA